MSGYTILRKLHILSALVICALTVQAQESGRRTIALTFDDLPLAIPGDDQAPGRLADIQRTNTRILKILAVHHATAIGFVNEINLNVANERDARAAVLRQWLNAGMDLGNHTYSHPALSEVETAEYEDAFVRGTTITSVEMKVVGKAEKYFRYPYLDTGKGKDQKEAIIAFYASRGFVNAPVTVQNQDWLFNAPYSEAIAQQDVQEQKRVIGAYLQHTADALAYAEELSKQSFGRETSQVMLLHIDQLNSDELDALLSLLEKRGYEFVSLEEALRDPAYATPDAYVGPEGLIWLERWQISLGKPFHPNEPNPPKWAQDAYRRITGHEP